MAVAAAAVVEECWPATLRTSFAVNFVMFPALVPMPTLLISVEPSTRRYEWLLSPLIRSLKLFRFVTSNC